MVEIFEVDTVLIYNLISLELTAQQPSTNFIKNMLTFVLVGFNLLHQC